MFVSATLCFSIRNRIELFEAVSITLSHRALDCFSIRNRIELFEASAAYSGLQANQVSVSATGSNCLKRWDFV